MNEILFTALLGIVIGAVDVLPMIRMKLDRYSIVSAFVFYLLLPFMIMNIDLYGLVWWLKGFIALALALPTIIMAAKDDKSSVPPMVVMSVVLGTIISAIQHFML